MPTGYGYPPAATGYPQPPHPSQLQQYYSPVPLPATALMNGSISFVSVPDPFDVEEEAVRCKHFFSRKPLLLLCEHITKKPTLAYDSSLEYGVHEHVLMLKVWNVSGPTLMNAVTIDPYISMVKFVEARYGKQFSARPPSESIYNTPHRKPHPQIDERLSRQRRCSTCTSWASFSSALCFPHSGSGWTPTRRSN